MRARRSSDDGRLRLRRTEGGSSTWNSGAVFPSARRAVLALGDQRSAFSQWAVVMTPSSLARRRAEEFFVVDAEGVFVGEEDFEAGDASVGRFGGGRWGLGGRCGLRPCEM